MGSLLLLGTGKAGAGAPATPQPPNVILTGVIGWWDASVFASITFSSADNIESIADQSGLGNTATWGGFGRPKYNATALNGRPCFNFRATIESGSFNVTSFPMGTGNTLTVWAVCTLLDPTDHFGCADSRVVGYSAPGQGDYNYIGSWAMHRPTFSHTQMVFIRNGTPYTTMGWAGGSPHRLIVTVDSSGLQTFYIDGSTASIVGSPATRPGNWVSAGTLGIADTPGTGSHNYWDGPMGEVGVATGYSNSTVVAQLDAYLAAKWGL